VVSHSGPPKTIMVVPDSRGRVVLTGVRQLAHRYNIRQEPDGTVILTPVRW